MERLDQIIKFDHDKLLEDVKKYVFTLGEKCIQGEEYETKAYHGFGGWSLLSRSGSWKDGFEFFQNDEGEAMEVYFPQNDNNYKALKFFNITMPTLHNKPTEGYKGEIANVLDQIKELGFYPTRARITCLKAGCKSLVHRDASGDGNQYMARIHIPLITNPKCNWIQNGQKLHMEKGSTWIVWVNDWHQIRNDSDEDRYHLIMDAYDTKKITEFFKYEGKFEELIEWEKQVQKLIDDTIITPEEFEKFESVRKTFITNPKHV